jgi:hypothetical protein
VTTQNVALTASSAGSNLALNKSFTASRYESSQYAPSKAGDGDAATFWWSDDHGDDESREWIGVDLGSTYRVGKVEIAWQGTYWAKEYRLYTSMDAKEWKEVYSTSRAQSGTNSVTFSARDARYVKLECRKTGSGQSNGYGVAELRVFAP